MATARVTGNVWSGSAERLFSAAEHALMCGAAFAGWRSP